jgi:hypothetical protein
MESKSKQHAWLAIFFVLAVATAPLGGLGIVLGAVGLIALGVLSQH